MIGARQLTPTESRAHVRRKAFHLAISEKAAALAASKPAAPAPLLSMSLQPMFGATPPAPQASAVVKAEAFPAETDPPIKKKLWFAIVGIVANTLTIAQIKSVVADEFGIPVEAMNSPRRLQKWAFPRQIAMWLCRDILTSKSLPAIGRAFGNRDHTTVLHACRVAPAKVAADPDIAARVAKIRADLAEVIGETVVAHD